MLTKDASMHDIYTQTYGKVMSGSKIANSDYCYSGCYSGYGGATPYNTTERIAVTVAINDQKNNIPMRNKSDLEQEIKRLQS